MFGTRWTPALASYRRSLPRPAVDQEFRFEFLNSQVQLLCGSKSLKDISPLGFLPR
jgi:predicted dithiol-disulfide oxidoreductase (DUF899 family)